MNLVRVRQVRRHLRKQFFPICKAYCCFYGGPLLLFTAAGRDGR